MLELRRGGLRPSPLHDGAGSAREGCAELTAFVRLPAVVARVAIVLKGGRTCSRGESSKATQPYRFGG
jgi:hypothetical protein